MSHPTWPSKCPERALPFPGSSGTGRIRPGTTGRRFTRAKHSSVLRNTTEGLMRCCPNLSMVRADLQGLKETMVEIIKGLTLPFPSNRNKTIKQPVQLPAESASWAHQLGVLEWLLHLPGNHRVFEEGVEKASFQTKTFIYNFLKSSLIILDRLQNSGDCNFSLPFSFALHCKYLGHMLFEKHK